jgi:transcriptional regulator with XRE-family HTH domain
MNRKDFTTASLAQLELATGIDRHRWSRYINGKVAMNERTLNKAAQKLEIKPEELLSAIQARRESKGVAYKDNLMQA